MEEGKRCSRPGSQGGSNFVKREAVDTENATHEVHPDAFVRSGLCGPLKHSRTTAPGRREAPYPRKRSRTMPCSDGDDTYESASQAVSQKKRRGPSILVNMTFRETSDHTFICGRQSIANQFPDVVVDEDE